MRAMRIPARCAQAVEAGWFTTIVFVTILVNAVAIGAETYPGFAAANAELLAWINHVCLGIFTVELVVRLTAHAPRFGGFFRSGWNVFDFVIVTASFLPFVGESTTILRLIRLGRIVRVVSLFPDLRVLLIAIGRSVPPIASMGVLGVLVVYVYAVIGWILFGAELPDRYGDVGTAMLNLFVMLTLENLPENLSEGMAVHPWSWIYFVSFALTASFLLLNVLIGIVINSMEEAREIEHKRLREERRAMIAHAGEDHEIDAAEQQAMIAEKLESLRDALDNLEEELESSSPPGPGRGSVSG